MERSRRICRDVIKMKIIRTKIFNKEMTTYANKLSSLARAIKGTEEHSLIKALETFSEIDTNFLVIGGIAYSIYAPARETEDVDVLFRSEKDLKDFKSEAFGTFKWKRGHALDVNEVEIETLTPEFIKTPKNIVNYVFKTKVKFKEGYAPSVGGLLLLKLSALRDKDLGDIHNLLKSNLQKINWDILYKLCPSDAAKDCLDRNYKQLEYMKDDFIN